MTDNNTPAAVPLADTIDRLIQRITLGIGWSFVLLVLVIILQVTLRKGFSQGLIALEELQWHLYAIGVMFGLAYAQTTDAHIRVDLFHGRFRTRSKRLIEILGILFLLLPFIGVIFLHSLDFLYDSWRINESSSAPSGLPWRWLIKGVIPVSFALLALAVLSRLYREIILLMRGE
ncbi:TRAP transporter small permease subunit [Marinobacterium rhizophilum]|uniref:TRAP transporter small permease protein n=1 Tax=Marinobacterium rhizophilum TaxID=420402 RepID=A0ABY5HKT4_9GAMM|nr:TRAP transporter small permease subunit [Marinobacterium rhizophilum]UTW13006.1 TRAP transporter small permease subunit [Marinobacterium rhizophilum]UTW14131.1 TRAP transporter small permease subunit [Marinobacterium rhizophilum]